MFSIPDAFLGLPLLYSKVLYFSQNHRMGSVGKVPQGSSSATPTNHPDY